MTILLADDDPITLDTLEACLVPEGFQVFTACDGVGALEVWKRHKPDLLCLDIMMPRLDGYEVCRRVRADDSKVPVLFISAKSEEIDVVVGLQLGADDFVRKPFGKQELLARIHSALRRSGKNSRAAGAFQMLDLTVFPLELRAERGGVSIDLTPREVAMLTQLLERANQVVTRDEMLDRCWGLNYFPGSRTLDQHIAKLRKKIEREASEPQIIDTVRGVGYRYRP